MSSKRKPPRNKGFAGSRKRGQRKPHSLQPSMPKKNWWTRTRKITGGIIAFIITIGSLWAIFRQGQQEFTPIEERHNNERNIQKIIAPFPIKNKVKIDLGGGSVSLNVNGINANSDQFTSFGCWYKDTQDNLQPDNAFALIVKVINGTEFYISTVVKDLKDGSVLLEIIENKIVIDNIGAKYIHSTSTELEIMDRYLNVPFCLWIDSSGLVHARGYFYGNYCTTFFNDHVMKYVYHNDPERLQKAMEYAAEVKPRFIKK